LTTTTRALAQEFKKLGIVTFVGTSCPLLGGSVAACVDVFKLLSVKVTTKVMSGTTTLLTCENDACSNGAKTAAFVPEEGVKQVVDEREFLRQATALAARCGNPGKQALETPSRYYKAHEQARVAAAAAATSTAAQAAAAPRGSPLPAQRRHSTGGGGMPPPRRFFAPLPPRFSAPPPPAQAGAPRGAGGTAPLRGGHEAMNTPAVKQQLQAYADAAHALGTTAKFRTHVATNDLNILVFRPPAPRRGAARSSCGRRAPAGGAPHGRCEPCGRLPAAAHDPARCHANAAMHVPFCFFLPLRRSRARRSPAAARASPTR
jgi:hypothetical protein